MNKNYFLFLFCTVALQVFSQNVNTHQIDYDEARQIAINFFDNYGSVEIMSTKRYVKRNKEKPILAYKEGTGDNVSFYVFNDNLDGFVIISGKSDMPTILGYSYTGAFDYERAPKNFLWWMKQYETCGAIKRTNSNSAKHSIEPLLTTKWGQNEPFNNAIPSLGANYNSFPTGCTATAMAQVMKYHEYPQHGIGYNNYSITYNGTNTLNFYADFANTYYDWNNMLDDYSKGYNQTQANAVATLMYHAGVSENIKYHYTDMSAADSDKGAIALINNFSYDKGLMRGERKYFNDDDWENIIYNELANGRPVLYSGTSVTGEESIGHEFICHGYDANYNLYAINWGWEGLYDGYFALTGKAALNPNKKGVPLNRRASNNSNADCNKRPTLNYKLVPATGEEKQVIGVVADGVSQVKIALEKQTPPPSDNCGYNYSWELSENIGTLENAESYTNIIYTAPQDYPEDKNGCGFTIQAKLTASNGEVSHSYTVDIQIFRVPVLFVHGLNDKPACWNTMRLYLRYSLYSDRKKYYSDPWLHCVDYKETHNDHFEDNKYVVGKKAEAVKKELLDAHKIVCNKVDVIGHSMGGLLTKKFIQENGPELFHKVITINTPHGGSQLGNLVTSPIVTSIVDYTNTHVCLNDSRYPFLEKPIDKEYYRVGREILSSLLHDFLPSNSTSINDGAVFDLKVGGDAINKINTSINGVKCHAIVTSFAIAGLEQTLIDWLTNLLGIWKCLGYNNTTDFLRELYNREKSDLVVPLPSQYGGLSGSYTSRIDGYHHLSSIGSSVVKEKVFNLLMSPTNSSAFSNGFFKTPDLSFYMPTLESVKEMYPVIFGDKNSQEAQHQKNKVQKVGSNSISLELTYTLGGENLNYHIVNANNYRNIAFACMYSDNLVGYTEVPEGTINLPKHQQGNLVVICEGENKDNGEWEFVSDTIQIRTFNDSDLEKIEFGKDTIYIRENEVIGEYVTCFWKDSTTSVLDSPNFSIANQQIATISTDNRIKAHKKGVTTIKASYLGKECSSVIDVYNTPTELVSLFDEDDMDNYGYTSDQIIYYNIKPEEGGEYTVCPATYDNVTLTEQNGDIRESINIDRLTESEKNLYFSYTPYNSGLSDAKFQYGIIFRNIINGHIYSKYGGSTDNLSNKYLPSGYHYSRPISISFNTSILLYNGVYDVLPAYSLDNGNTWQIMYYNASQIIPQITIEGGENDDLVSLPLNITSQQIQIGKSSYITYSPFYTGQISYASSDKKIVDVKENGEVLGISKGNATINVNIGGDSFYKEESIAFTISVIDHERNPLILGISKTELKKGETAVIKSPNSYYGSIDYDVYPDGIVKVSPSGLVSALSSGHAIITAKSSPTYDYYETTNAITIDVKPTPLKLDEGLCISKIPKIGTENVISEGNSTMSVTVLNNTDKEIKNATLYYRLYLDNGRYTNRWAWTDLSAGRSFTHEFDLLTLKDYMTQGKQYNCYFYKDEDFSQPMNVPLITFQYGVKEIISVILNNNCATLSLPFDSDIPAGLHAYEVNTYYEDILVMTEVPQLYRNHSYIICGDSKTYQFTGVIIPTLENPRYGFMTGLHNDLIIPKGNFVITEDNEPLVRRLTENEQGQKWSAYLTLPSSSDFPFLFPNDIANSVARDMPSESHIIGIYNNEGMRIPHLQRGFNILKYSNGEIKKIIIR